MTNVSRPQTVYARVQTLFERHQNFILLLLLFVSFRFLAVVAFRPGGLILDFSDFYWYREYVQLERQGYIAYDNLWTPYPPLFPFLKYQLWQLSAMLPPWGEANLWFDMFMGSTFLIFETGSFILLYLMAWRIYGGEQALKPVWIYACLFFPVYTVTGWFESYPIFFFILSFYLLLIGKPYLSAFFSGVGFLTKLIPVILIPVGLKVIPATKRWGQIKIRPLRLTIDVQAALIYGGIFAGTVLLIAFPFYRQNPNLILSPLLITALRPSWQTIWAVIEGNYAYGISPLDMRDMAWPPADASGSPLPWPWITGLFGILYLWLYSRQTDWQRPLTLCAFTGLTVAIFFLYSKGYSPQWIGWLLFFNALLLPNFRGVLYAVVLNINNIIEASFFFIMFPEEHWLFNTTVIVRTIIIFILAVEFGLIIWPHWATTWVIRTRNVGLAIGLLGLFSFGLLSLPRLTNAYFTQRLSFSPYQSTIEWLDEQPVKEAILLNTHPAYDWFYPYLRQSHTFYMLDDYADSTTTVAGKTTTLLDAIAKQHQAVWVYDSDPAVTTPSETVLIAWLQNAQLAHQADIDRGRLYLYIFQPKSTP